ncbi:hypothetical protein [Spiroplasma turonicum]|uniref:Transmembrane protein n=1 Tax=Spiroplasma turonicum TaxID=216946 RepID=A0A0K1P6M0_9MOLU|nr:hypothetical protein [Spiroplasma turonicum]AKU79966.1 transmembrane protein [Spiroplasma turonicum]ALX70977.1 ABC transporter permease [Spiroplasma turonicum]
MSKEASTIKIKIKDLINFFYRILIHEKVFVIYFIIINSFSLLVSVLFSLIKSGETKNLLFDFYVIIFINIFLFIFIIKIINFFFVRKIEDKTIFVVIANSFSRIRFFITQYFTLLIIITSPVFFSYIMFNIVYILSNDFTTNNFVIKKTLVFMLFSIILEISLFNFLVFLILFIGNQPTLVISTLLLSFSFVANIPAKLIWESEKDKIFTFKDFNNNESYDIYQTDVYNSIALEGLIINKKIKYKNLIHSLNHYLTNYSRNDNIIFTINNLNNNNLIRYNEFWKNEMGIVVPSKKEISFDGILLTNSKKTSLKKWSLGDKIKINLSLNSYFKNEHQIRKLLNCTSSEGIKSNIADFLSFKSDLKKTIINIPQQKYNLFGDYLFLSNNINSNQIINLSKNEKIDLDVNDIKSIFNFIIAGVNPIDDKDFTIRYSEELKNYFYDNIINDEMFLTRILENYLIYYTTHYYYSTNYSLVQNDTLRSYLDIKKKLNIMNFINPFYLTWVFYTNKSGLYYDDIWFNPNSTSLIELNKQQNLFLPYIIFDLKNINNKFDQNSFNNFIDPSYLFITLFLISKLLFLSTIKKFNKIDFN